MTIEPPEATRLEADTAGPVGLGSDCCTPPVEPTDNVEAAETIELGKAPVEPTTVGVVGEGSAEGIPPVEPII